MLGCIALSWLGNADKIRRMLKDSVRIVVAMLISAILVSCGGGGSGNGGGGGGGSAGFTVPGRIVSDRLRQCLESQAILKGWRNNSDVRSIECQTDFSGPDDGIGVENLEGVEVFSNLEVIIIYGSGRWGLGQIDDLSPLNGLNRLHTIEMYSSGLQSLESIRNLTSLQRLVIIPSNLNGLSPLTTLSNLKHLNISGATTLAEPISDFSPLGQLSGLEELHLQAHYTLKQDGLGFLNGMTSLRFLNLAENGLQDANGIQNLPALEELDLSYNNFFLSFDDTEIENILGGLSNLKKFWYAGFDGEHVGFLQGMPGLELLTLSRYYLPSDADLATIGGLTNLRELTLSGFADLDVSFLQGLSNLEFLWLGNGTVDSVTLAFPATLSSLRELHMLDAFSRTYSFGDSRGDFKNTYAVFKDLPALQTLNLAKPWLLDESAVTLNPNVRNLSLVQAKLGTVEFLRDKAGIVELDLSKNLFTELDPVATMPDLLSLTLNETMASCAEVDEYRAAAPQVAVTTDLYCP